jgi:hypothetical protein
VNVLAVAFSEPATPLTYAVRDVDDSNTPAQWFHVLVDAVPLLPVTVVPAESVCAAAMFGVVVNCSATRAFPAAVSSEMMALVADVVWNAHAASVQGSAVMGAAVAL